MSSWVVWLPLFNPLIGIFLAGLASRIFMISLPSVARGLETDILGISWALISFQIATICLGVVFGRLGDIYGHRKLYGFGIIVITASSLLCGLAQDLLQLIVFRFLQGVGGAVIQSAGRALALESMRAGTEGKAQGFMATAHHLGFFVGPPLGGLIIDALDWRWIFYFMVPFGMAGIFLTYTRFAIPNRPPAEGHFKRPAVDYPGTVLFIFLAGVLTLMLDHRAAQALGVENRWLLILAFGGALIAFLVHENRSSSPMMSLSLFKIRTFTLGILGLTAATMTHGLIGLIMPFYLQDVLHIAPSFIGLIFLLPSIFTITLATVSGNITDRSGPRMPLITGAVALIVTFVLGYHLETASHWLFPTIVLGLTGIAGAFFNIPVQTAIIGAVPKEHRGFAAGIIHTIFGLGHLLGISAAKLILALAFQAYSGIPGAAPTPGDPPAFVFAMNMTYVAGLAASLTALATALLIKNDPAR